MTTADWIKLAIILPLFLGFGPALGVAVKGKPRAQRWLFGAMCFMTINGLFAAGNWGLTLASEEFYRGHAKGYHFYFNQILAIGLITAKWLEDRKSFRWVPPGMFLYGLFIIICTLSILNAPRQDYVLMATHKMVIFAVIAIASFNTLKTGDDLKFLLRVMAWTMIWQAFIVLKMKYLQGIYQVRGTFEHQNPLSMYSLMIGLPFLAVGLGPKFKGQGVCLGGFIACAIIVQSALSRAALVLFAVGAAGVAVASLLEKPTSRRLTVLSGMGMVGALGLLLTLDTIVSRFHDEGNTASSELRDVLNEAARQMREAHPLGVGWNNYALVINSPYPYADVVYEWIRGRNMKVDETKPNAPVESHYYLLIGENGYAGLVAWLLVITSGVWRNFRGFVSFPHSFERCLCLGLIAGTSLNYIQSTLERVLTQPRNLMLWLILFGVTARLEIMRRAYKKSGRMPEEEPADGFIPAEEIPAAALPAPALARSGWAALPRIAPSLERPTAPGRGEPAPGPKPEKAEPVRVGKKEKRRKSVKAAKTGITPLSRTPTPTREELIDAPPPKWADVSRSPDAPAEPALLEPARPAERPWWRKRRVWISGVFSLSMGVTAWIAWARGQHPRIVIINASGKTLTASVVEASGEEHPVPALEDGEAHRWIVDTTTSNTRVTLRYDGRVWTETYPDTLSGLRISLAVLPDGTVDEQHLLSPWREWISK